MGNGCVTAADKQQIRNYVNLAGQPGSLTPAGETFVVTINSKRYTFTVPSRVISLVDNVTDADFVADP